jgi:hypothetical protein
MINSMKTIIVLCALLFATAANAAEYRTCRGLVTINWTEGVADGTPDEGSRLIRADDITASCLFNRDSNIGKKILRVCRMGHACKVRIEVDDEPADVYIIKKVYSVKEVG